MHKNRTMVLGSMVLATGLLLTGCATAAPQQTSTASPRPSTSAKPVQTEPTPFDSTTPSSTSTASARDEVIARLQGRVNSEVTNVQVAIVEGMPYEKLPSTQRFDDGTVVSVIVDGTNFTVQAANILIKYGYKYESTTGEFTVTGDNLD